MISNINYEELINKFEPHVIKNIDIENLNKIVRFLMIEKFDYIDEIVENYLDLFLIDYEEFVNKYQLLKIKYGENLVELISEDLGILEELI